MYQVMDAQEKSKSCTRRSLPKCIHNSMYAQWQQLKCAKSCFICDRLQNSHNAWILLTRYNQLSDGWKKRFIWFLKLSLKNSLLRITSNENVSEQVKTMKMQTNKVWVLVNSLAWRKSKRVGFELFRNYVDIVKTLQVYRLLWLLFALFTNSYFYIKVHYKDEA